MKLDAEVRAFFGAPHPQSFVFARWIVLRGLALIYFSAFFSFARQVDGLIGKTGILPAAEYLAAARQAIAAPLRYYEVPTLLWMGAENTGLHVVVAIGLVASCLLFFNLLPRPAALVCFLSFLSLISVSQVFAGYQSDGMLLEAGLLASFLAPSGLRPGLASSRPPIRAIRFLFVWEWFRIYFESGVVKLSSGDPQWKNLTALDHYYENGPLPTWIGWYAQQLPHAFHAATAFVTLAIELGWVWLAFLPRRYRLTCFAIVTPFQLAIIATANYAFLNYLVLLLGFFLVDDRAFRMIGAAVLEKWPDVARRIDRVAGRGVAALVPSTSEESAAAAVPVAHPLRRAGNVLRAGALALLFYTTLLRFPLIPAYELPGVLTWPAQVLEPFRVANRYGLFAVMTQERIEIEFQGSLDGVTFVPYPFRFKPQDPHEAPGIYAPYQPRFDWNLWFCSLEDWRGCRWVVRTEALLLTADRSVLSLFAGDPFGGKEPKEVRTVSYRYWFSNWEAKKTRGVYWEREEIGPYAPALERTPDGTIRAVR